MDIWQPLLVVITGGYTLASFLMMRATQVLARTTQQQMESLTRPYVSVRTELTQSRMIRLRVENTGKSAAENLSLKMDRHFYSFDDEKPEHDIAQARAFREMIDCFPPGAHMFFELAHASRRFEPDSQTAPAVFRVTASYSYGIRHVNETTTVDLRAYEGSSYAEEPLEELRSIRKSLDQFERTVRELFRKPYYRPETSRTMFE